MKYLCFTPILLLVFPIISIFQNESHGVIVTPNPVSRATVIKEHTPNVVEEDTSYLAQMPDIPPFDFSTFEIEQHEGCTDSLVYPGGASGPTISCGLDLGNAGYKTVVEILKYNVSDSIYQILIKATSIRGSGSQEWIRRNQVHIGDKVAGQICNTLKVYIWRQLTFKYPNLENAPAQVKTAMLDITFQAGIGSKRMSGFGKVISEKNWRKLGRMIEISYSDFAGGRYHSIHQRRVDHGKQIQFIYDPPKNVTIDYD